MHVCVCVRACKLLISALMWRGSLVAFGRAAEAAGLFARSLAVREAILGPEHPFTVATRCEREREREREGGREGGREGEGEREEEKEPTHVRHSARPRCPAWATDAPLV